MSAVPSVGSGAAEPTPWGSGGSPPRAALSRRAFLARAGGTAATAALTAGGLGSLLSACDSRAVNADLRSQPPPPSPRHPATWPISAGNKPIADGRLAERDATLQVYTWPGRIAGECLDKFSRRYGCQIKLTTFDSAHQAIATMTTRPTRFDVFLGAPIAMLGSLIGSNLIQPLNHSYLPNISQVWQPFTNPFYDQHWRYTVPYTVYSTGIGWRRDLVDVSPYSMTIGWELFWHHKYSGRVGILDDYREGISLGLLANDLTDLSTSDPLLIDTAARSLSRLGSLVHPKLSNNAARDLAAGTTLVRHAWSGQVAAASKKLPPTAPRDALAYWFPPSGLGPMANDTITIPRSAQSPVLAHLFMNFMLDTPNAVVNARAIGYLQPMTWMTPTRLVSHGVLPAGLVSTAVLEYDFYRGLRELALQPASNALWQQAWQSAVARMRLSRIL